MKQMALYSSHDFLHIPSQCTVILVFNMKCTAFTMGTLCNHSYKLINVTYYRVINFLCLFLKENLYHVMAKYSQMS